MPTPFRARLATSLAAAAVTALAALPLAAQQPAARPAPAPQPPRAAPAPAPATAPRRAPRVEVDRWELERALHDAQWEMQRGLLDAQWELERMAPHIAGAAELGAAEAVRAMADVDLTGHAWPAMDMELAHLADAMRDVELSAATALAPLEWEVRAEVEAALAGVAHEGWGAPRFRTTAPAPWAQQDPADSLYRVAREALNRGDNRRAATLFAQLAERHPRSAYAADAAYYEAFARYRLRTEPELRNALRVLEARLARNVNSSTSSDAAALAARIRGELASGSGNADVARQRAELLRSAGAGDGCDREDAAVRIEALNALAKIDSTAVLPSVRRVLANQAPCAASLRESAVLILGRSRSPEAEGMLIQAARGDSSSAVRSAALAWLARSPSERAIATIEEILRTASDGRTQSAAIRALARSDHPRSGQILRQLAERADASHSARAAAIREISRDTSAATAAYLRALYGRVDVAALKHEVIAGVARDESPASAQWLAAIVSDTSETIDRRRFAMSHYTRRAATVADLARLYDATPQRELRETVISALVRRTEPEATDKLLAIARSDENSRLRRAAIGALARKDDPRTTRLLQEIIDRTP